MAKKQTKVAKVKDTIKQENENGSRKAVLEDLFYDFHRARKEIFLMNFIRGFFFGLGSSLGASVVVALIVWFLSQFTGIFPELNEILKTIRRR